MFTLKINFEVFSTFLALISLTLASCGTQDYETGCIDISQSQISVETANKHEVSSEVLSLIHSKDLYDLRTYFRKQDYYYFKMKEDSQFKCGEEKFKSPLISYQFHYPSDNPDLLGNVLITYSSNQKIEYVSFSSLGDPGAWFPD